MLFSSRSHRLSHPHTDPNDSPVLDAERLDVYQLALDFQLLASSLVPRGQPTLRNQLEGRPRGHAVQPRLRVTTFPMRAYRKPMPSA